MNNQVYKELVAENDLLRTKLNEANDTLEAIRNGQVDAFVVNGNKGNALYTLKSADQAYRVFIEQMAEGAVSLNSEGIIIYSNSQFARMVDRPLFEVLGRPFTDFVAASHSDEFQTLLKKAWCQNAKAEVDMTSGSDVVSVQLSLNMVEVEGEKTLSAIITDLTGRREIERQLKLKNERLEELNNALTSSNHDLQQFASVASHDLQEPVRKIQVFSKFLKDRSFDELSEASKLYVEKIITASNRMKVLIMDILTFSRLSANDVSMEMIDMTELFREILDDFDLRISEKGANVQLNPLCQVEGNRGQLRQVFHNLISNALKFTAAERTPSLTIERKDIDAAALGIVLDDPTRYCRISVSDNGIGFDEKFSTLIFSLFEKLNPKSSYEGSGIGLAIAKKIIDKHHGFILARSVVDGGSEFSVILPYKQPQS